jgi:hypothetical protein
VQEDAAAHVDHDGNDMERTEAQVEHGSPSTIGMESR